MPLPSKDSRRSFLKKGGVVAVGSLSAVGTAAAKTGNDVQTLTFPKEAPLDAERSRIENVPGAELSQRDDGTWVIKANTRQLPSPAGRAFKKAKTARNQTLKEASSQVEQSVQQAESASGADPTVSLGSDSYLYDMTTGDAGGSSTGVVQVVAGSHYHTDTDRATSACLGGSGAGSVTRWSWIGVPITVTGSGSAAASVSVSGAFNGFQVAVGGGTFSTNIDFYLKNTSTGTVYSTGIYSKSSGAFGGSYTGKTNFNNGLSATLHAGDSYVAYVRVQTNIGIYGAVDASSDFGPEDGDNDSTYPQGATVNHVSIIF